MRDAWWANDSTTQDIDVDQMIATMSRLKAEDAVRKSRTKFDMMGMRCGVCGKKVVYHESPEALVVCRHVYEKFRRLPKPKMEMPEFCGLPGLYGLRIEVVD